MGLRPSKDYLGIPALLGPDDDAFSAVPQNKNPCFLLETLGIFSATYACLPRALNGGIPRFVRARIPS